VVDFAVFLLLEQRPVDYHVEFVGAGGEGHACFLQFVVGVLGALVEADDAGDEDVAAFEVGVGLGDVVWSDADALYTVLVSMPQEQGEEDHTAKLATLASAHSSSICLGEASSLSSVWSMVRAMSILSMSGQ